MLTKEQYSNMVHCCNRNTCYLRKLYLTWPYFTLPEEYEFHNWVYEYVKTTDLNSFSLPMWYSILGKCRHMFVAHKNYPSYFNTITFEDLPDNCKLLLSENIKMFQKKNNTSLEDAQKWSLLTAIVVSWKKAYSAMKSINERGALTYEYKLTEAVFILHLRPTNSITDFFKNIFKSDKYEDEDMLFYAKCLTGALARVLKNEKRVSSDFKFEILTSDDLKTSFMRNIKKLMENVSYI